MGAITVLRSYSVHKYGRCLLSEIDSFLLANLAIISFRTVVSLKTVMQANSIIIFKIGRTMC